MRKRNAAIGLAVACALAFPLSACGGGTTSTTAAGSGGTGAATASVEENEAEDRGTGDAGASDEDLSGQVSIDQEYWYSDEGDVTHVIVFTNKSSETVSVQSSSEALDSSGETVGVGDADTLGIGPGCTSVLSEYIEGAEGTAKFKTELTASADEDYDSVVQDLKVDVSAKGDKAIVRITNNGDKDAEFVEGHALFLKDGKLVYSSSEYFGNDDDVLAPGKTVSKQIESYSDAKFDSVKVYTTGRAERE